jgi:hypothetical protein
MARNVKIPKKIAGVKIPKKARKTANKAIKMSASPVVRELAAAAIGAAGAKAAGERKTPDEGARHVGGGARLQIDGGRIGEAFRTAAIDGLRRFLEGFEEGLRNISEPADADEGRPAPSGVRASRPGAARD